MVLLALSLAAQAAERPLVHGHRGARAVAPENTLPAFRYALEVGVDVLELDVVVTGDDQLLVAHDPIIDPAICQRADGGAIPEGMAARAHTLAELQALDCGSRVNPRFPDQRPVPGEPMPSLDQVFELVASSPQPAAAAVRLNIEAKIVPGRPELSADPEHLAALLIDCFRRHGAVDRVILQSFDHRVLAAAHALEPGLIRSQLAAEEHLDLSAIAGVLGADIYSPHHLWITAEDVRALHAAGIAVHPWTANTPADWDRLIGLGVDGIITDDPAALIKHLDQRLEEPDGR